MRDRDTDLIIVGGGLAGASLALAVAQLVPELRVTLVEQYPLAAEPLPGDYQPSYDARSTALAWGSRLIFEQLGLWPRLSQHATPIRHVHVSDRGHFGVTRLHAEDHHQEALGYVADNRWMGQCLVSALQTTRVRWLAPAEVVDVKPETGAVAVVVRQDGREQAVSGRCLVVADGGRSGLREKLGFRSRTLAYDQNALIATVSTSEPHNFTAYERFSESGPMALLPHGSPQWAGHESALVWTLDDEALAEVLTLSGEDKCRRLQSHFGWRLGRFTRIGECHHYPLKLVTVDEMVRPRVALIGNAAHALHPVAGQGFNLALRGLMALAEQFRRAVDEGHDIGALPVLQAYQQQHRQDWLRTVYFSDSLIRLFGAAPGPLVGARNAGLVGLDLLPPAKHWFTRIAMGLGGRWPLSGLRGYQIREAADDNR